jgi:hypothetical protein
MTRTEGKRLLSVGTPSDPTSMRSPARGRELSATIALPILRCGAFRRDGRDAIERRRSARVPSSVRACTKGSAVLGSCDAVRDLDVGDEATHRRRLCHVFAFLHPRLRRKRGPHFFGRRCRRRGSRRRCAGRGGGCGGRLDRRRKLRVRGRVVRTIPDLSLPCVWLHSARARRGRPVPGRNDVFRCIGRVPPSGPVSVLRRRGPGIGCNRLFGSGRRSFVRKRHRAHSELLRPRLSRGLHLAIRRANFGGPPDLGRAHAREGSAARVPVKIVFPGRVTSRATDREGELP